MRREDRVKTHTTRDGTVMKLTEMSNQHLDACIRMFERRAKEGLTLRYGGGFDAADIWYDEYTIYGKEALEYLNYDDYVHERERRKCGGRKE